MHRSTTTQTLSHRISLLPWGVRLFTYPPAPLPPSPPAAPLPSLFSAKDYNNAVDMWSLGCILAELLSMQKESFPTSQERNALFPGKSCFPLSAEKPSSYSDALDQLNVIFDVIGTPSREDIKDLVRWIGCLAVVLVLTLALAGSFWAEVLRHEMH